MKSILLMLMISMFCNPVFSQEKKPEIRSVAFECLGKTETLPLTFLIGMIPFLGNPKAIYQDLKYGDNSYLLREQEDAVGLDDNSFAFSTAVNVGILSPLLDLTITLVGTGILGYEKLKSIITDDPSSFEDRLPFYKDSLALPVTRHTLGPVVLQGKEAVMACSQLKDMLANKLSVSQTARSEVKESKSPSKSGNSQSQGRKVSSKK